MTVAADQAVRAWVNSLPELVGTPGAPGPLAMGAYSQLQRSPASGAYAVISRQLGPVQQMIAEGTAIDCATILAEIRAGTPEAADQSVTRANPLTSRSFVPVNAGGDTFPAGDSDGQRVHVPAPDRRREGGEELDTIFNAPEGRTASVTFALAQLTATNFQVAPNGGTITMAGAVVTFEPPD